MSNALQRDLTNLVKRAEAFAASSPRTWAQRIHLMPPVGWLNDPNGLYQKDGVFHAYFQYAPFDVAGGVKMWGHSVSRDLLTWDYDGCVLMPDEPFDCHGVYSGSALVHDGRVTMFYTGNVKLPDADGSYDYISTGREANTIAVDTRDGSQFGEKRLLMTNADYPSGLTCHVRDPKVWRADAPCGRYLMVQGARRVVASGDDDLTARESLPVRAQREELFALIHGERWCSDAGEILVFASDDLVTWRLQNSVTSPGRFGFMWECPDYFELLPASHDGIGAGVSAEGTGVPADAAAVKILSASPQGLTGEEWEHRNLYQSGYFKVSGEIYGSCELGEFRLWDAGFDFYAPQTFGAEDGRRILIGWMGMPDDPTYGNDPTVAEGWQHCLTLPREITVGEDGVVRQAPVRELKNLRGMRRTAESALKLDEVSEAFDIEIDGIDAEFSVTLGGELSISWRAERDGTPARLEMRFAHTGRSTSGCGRTARWERLDRVDNVRIVADTSSVEVFANDGELAMTTRWYPARRTCEIAAPNARICSWELVQRVS